MLTKIHPSALAAGEGFDAVEVVGVDALVGVDDVELVWDAVEESDRPRRENRRG